MKRVLTLALVLSWATTVRMLGHAPKRSWRDYLDAAGKPKAPSQR